MKVFLFPGQGSQEVGMGADLFKSDSTFRDLVALASELVGEDLEPTCLRGPEKQLIRTRILQPLLVAVSLGYHRQLIERGVNPDLVLGHSLGEITALAAAGIVTPSDAVRIAAMRGRLMAEAAAELDGGMMATTLESREPLLDWLASITIHRVTLANNNAPTQVVLSGERTGLAACMKFVATAKLGKCRMLSVSGPWHSPLMVGAATYFTDWLAQIPMSPPCVPMWFNVTASPATAPHDIRSAIGSALARPVQWSGCMAALRALQPRLLIEVGPGRVLSGLARANDIGDATRILNVNNLRGVELAAPSQPGMASDSCSTRQSLIASCA